MLLGQPPNSCAADTLKGTESYEEWMEKHCMSDAPSQLFPFTTGEAEKTINITTRTLLREVMAD